jgi:hypothetical protein
MRLSIYFTEYGLLYVWLIRERCVRSIRFATIRLLICCKMCKRSAYRSAMNYGCARYWTKSIIMWYGAIGRTDGGGQNNFYNPSSLIHFARFGIPPRSLYCAFYCSVTMQVLWVIKNFVRLRFKELPVCLESHLFNGNCEINVMLNGCALWGPIELAMRTVAYETADH